MQSLCEEAYHKYVYIMLFGRAFTKAKTFLLAFIRLTSHASHGSFHLLCLYIRAVHADSPTACSSYSALHLPVSSPRFPASFAGLVVDEFQKLSWKPFIHKEVQKQNCLGSDGCWQLLSYQSPSSQHIVECGFILTL